MKLVIYTSDAELEQHAASYPNLVNFDPFTKTGEADDGRGYHASVMFIIIDPNSTAPSFPEAEFESVEFVHFPWPPQVPAALEN